MGSGRKRNILNFVQEYKLLVHRFQSGNANKSSFLPEKSHENIRLRQKGGINVKIPCCREALTVRKSVTICDNTQPISRIYSKLSTTEAENPHTVDVNRQI